MKTKNITLKLLIAGCATVLSLASNEAEKQQTVNPQYLLPGDSRKFSIEYTGKIREIPSATKKLRVWMPAPQTTSVQQIEQLEFTPKARLATENKYGNQIAYWEIDNPGSSIEMKMRFVCTRKEVRIDLDRLKTD